MSYTDVIYVLTCSNGQDDLAALAQEWLDAMPEETYITFISLLTCEVSR